MTVIGSPGQRGGPVDGAGPARAKTCRPDADNHDAGKLACAASPCMASGAGGAAFAKACGCGTETVAAAGTPKSRLIPGTMLGFSHQCSPSGGAPARNPLRLPPNATMARDSSGHSGCPGPIPWRRHMEAIALPNGPRIDAARAWIEPAGRSGRSCHHACTWRERRRRAARPCFARKRSRRTRHWTSHSGKCADASGPARSASGA
jgi:hypothetical protein